MPGGRPIEWTTPRIEALAKELEAWFTSSEDNYFYQGFFAERPDLHPDLIAYLQPLNDTFRRTIKRLEKLQEQRLVNQALRQKVNPVMAIFCLKNNHGYADKLEQRVESRNVNVDGKDLLAGKSEDELKDEIRKLTEAGH